MNTEQVKSLQAQVTTGPKRVRSPYLFPAYNFSMAQKIAERVEHDGAGSLSEETLAIALGLSAKSSGFNLKTLTARQFGLLTKQGEILSTAPLAKAIFKPKNDDEKKKAMADSFLAIPLFREVATRFRGESLPPSQTFRNILEREFGIDSKRVSDAERVLMDSARETGVLVTSGGNTYLSTERTMVIKTNGESQLDQPISPKKVELPTTGDTPPTTSTKPAPVLTGRVLLVIEEDDLLALDEAKFQQFWSIYGEIFKNRAMNRAKRP